MSSPLDHIIHLTSPGKLQETVCVFQEHGFEVLPGGKHADGLTENALIVLEDGVYIELIQFVQPLEQYQEGSPEWEARKDHWWASMKENGWIDYSLGDLTGPEDAPIGTTINERAKETGVNLEYDKGLEGGRIKPDGDILRWLVTFPAKQHLRGSVPFFCKDLTPRSRRVPWDKAGTAPTNKARIAAVTLKTTPENFMRYRSELSTVLGTSAEPSEDGRPGTAFWKLSSPASAGSIELYLQSAENTEETDWINSVAGIGLWEVAVRRTGSNNAQQFPSNIAQLKWD
ncbi:hypothetical protein FRC19_008585 [Serendipita sp. 401]|nr:hypothetical protein FRC19_008585 [Serendipita sp. 401]